jgi:hypothetical protein
VTPSTANRLEVGTAESPVAEAAHRTGQFGPLPSVLRPPPPSERKIRRDRPGAGEGGGRAIILCWLTGIFLAAILVWAFASALAQQQKPAEQKPATAAPTKNAPAPAKQQHSHNSSSKRSRRRCPSPPSRRFI